MTYIQEEWKPVVGFEEIYTVSENGKVRRVGSARGSVIGKILRPFRSKKGYEQIVLCKDGIKLNGIYIHVLVAAAFLGERPVGHVVNHIDANRTNNHYSNLEYVTQLQNVRHAVQLGRIRRGQDHWRTRLTNEQVIAIRQQCGTMTKREIGETFGVSADVIGLILQGKNWRHLLPDDGNTGVTGLKVEPVSLRSED